MDETDLWVTDEFLQGIIAVVVVILLHEHTYKQQIRFGCRHLSEIVQAHILFTGSHDYFSHADMFRNGVHTETGVIYGMVGQ